MPVGVLVDSRAAVKQEYTPGRLGRIRSRR